MKTKTRTFSLLKGFAPLLFLLIVLFTKPHPALAQKAADSSKLLKYELSIDLVPLIDNGQFGKVLFKLKTISNEKTKGAYRFGLQGSQESFIYKDVDNQDQYYGNVNLIFGYEKYKSVGNFKTYLGLDFTTSAYFSKYDDSGWDELSGFGFGLSPFIGIRYQISKSFSASFEAAWKNEIGFNKTVVKPEMRTDHSIAIISKIQMPYTFSFNYQF
jgi:hypothetical protein